MKKERKKEKLEGVLEDKEQLTEKAWDILVIRSYTPLTESEKEFLKKHFDEIDWCVIIEDIFLMCDGDGSISQMEKLIEFSEEDDVDLGKIFINDSPEPYIYNEKTTELARDRIYYSDTAKELMKKDTKEYARWVLEEMCDLYREYYYD